MRVRVPSVTPRKTDRLSFMTTLVSSAKREVMKTRSERTALDEKLLANARRPITEIAEDLNLTPQQVAEKMSVLLEDIGWMSERQEERYMLIELGELISDARARLKSAKDEDYSGIAKIVLGSMMQMADRWDKRKKLVEEDIEAITAANARTFGQAYDKAADYLFVEFRKLAPDVDISEAEEYALKRAALKMAAQKLDEKVSK